jgi:hypothetical protein
MAGIIHYCLLPRNKTHKMYKSNLIFAQTNAYFEPAHLAKIAFCTSMADTKPQMDAVNFY